MYKMIQMQTTKQNKIVEESKAKQEALKWRIAALCIPVAIVALMLMSVTFIKNKVTMNYHLSNSYRAGDIMLQLTMPVLDAALK